MKPASTWNVLQTRGVDTGNITITLNNILPGITLTSPLSASGAQFTATTTGTVAGYQNVSVTFTGSVSATAGIAGTLVVGANGSLPQGKSITFQVHMSKQ